MKGNHIIQAVNFNNGEALDLGTISKRLESNKLDNSDLDSILGGCAKLGSNPCPDGGSGSCPHDGCACGMKYN